MISKDKSFAWTRLLAMSAIFGLGIRDVVKDKKKDKYEITISGKAILGFFIWDTYIMLKRGYMTKDLLLHHAMCVLIPTLQFIDHDDKNVFRKITPYCILVELMALIGYAKVLLPSSTHHSLRILNILNSFFVRLPLWFYIGFKLFIPNITHPIFKPMSVSITLSMITLDILWLKQMLRI